MLNSHARLVADQVVYVCEENCGVQAHHSLLLVLSVDGFLCPLRVNECVAR